MKKFIISKSFLLLSIFNILIAINTFSQQNKGINYQGIARRVDGSPIIEQTISLKLSIKDGSVNGNDVYSEIHIVKTNTFGLFNVVIGSSGASVQIGTFNAIDWKLGNKFLQVEIDPNGGNNFVKMGISQLQSVPYAIYAEQAAPVGLATGDLSGNYPNPTVNKIQGRDISNLSPSVGQILKWDGKAWSPAKDESGTGVEGPKGDKGDPGLKGDKGDPGANGTDGAPGPKGDKGDPGANGLNGTNGAPGPKGDKGDPGANGDKGDPGANGANGTNGAPGPKGDKGDPGINGTDGAPGPKGDKGDPGANGLNGTNGAPGPKGDKGDPGINGTDGAPGPKGDKGDKGDPGANGANGTDGAPGPKGDKGDPGIDGISPQFNFTLGTIPYGDGNGNLQTNANLFWDNLKGSLNVISLNNPSLINPSLRVYPNSSMPTMPTWMRIGDDVVGAEFGISGGNDQFFVGTVQGDAVIKGFSGSDDKKLFIGAGLNSPANIIISPGGKTSLTGEVIIGGNKFPNNTGTAGMVLTTNGSGTTSWTNPSTSSTNLSSGITGILAITNGGTGASTKNFIDLNTNQSIDGIKTFIADLSVNGLSLGRGSGSQSTNTALGFESIFSNTNIPGVGSSISAFGYQSLKSNLYGNYNSAFGAEALKSNTNGEYNTALGASALRLNQTGYENVAIGFMALDKNTNNFNTALGTFTLENNTSGYGNTALGYMSLSSNNLGNNNTGIGYKSNVSGINLTNATAIGAEAIVDESNTIRLGNANVVKIKTAGKLTSGAITFPNIDGTSGQVLTTDGSGNVSWANQSSSGGSFVDLTTNQTINGNKTFTNDLIVNGLKLGHGAGNRTDNFTLGSNSMSKNTDGTYNSGLGVNALSENTSGSANTAFGHSSLNNNSTGNFNTAIGSTALMNNTSANYNVALGHAALSKNTTGGFNIGLGYAANNENTTGSQNIALGFEAGVISNNLTNTIAIGHQTKARANNQAVIGTGSISEVLMGEGLAVVKGGNYISSSDARLKDNIRTINYGLKEILLLNPVNFNWKKNSKEDIGFIAQEVKKVIPELVYGIEGDLTKNESLGVNYSQMVSVLTKAIQEQQSQIEDLNQSKIEQKQQIEELKILINKLIEKRN